MKRRFALAAAVLGALTLTGCTEIGAISQQTQIDVALGGLVSTLESDYGVTATTTKQMDAEYRFTVVVTIDAAEINRTNRVGVITAVDEVLAGSAFDDAGARFAIGSDEAPVYSQSLFGLDTLQSDLEYWATVESAVGAVSFTVYDDPDGEGPLTRTRGVHGDASIDYAALGSVELDSTALDTWGSLGVSAMGSVPSTEAVAVFTALTTTIPPQDYRNWDVPLALALDWTSEPAVANWYLTSSSLDYDMTDGESLEGTDPAASADWPIAVAAASRIAGADIRASLFAFFSPENIGGVVWFGECSTVLDANALDETLFAALQAAGVVMPPGSAPGWCSAG